MNADLCGQVSDWLVHKARSWCTLEVGAPLLTCIVYSVSSENITSIQVTVTSHVSALGTIRLSQSLQGFVAWEIMCIMRQNSLFYHLNFLMSCDLLGVLYWVQI